MKNKLLKTIYMLSKYALYGFVLQLLFLNFGLPIQAKGQYKKIEKVTINLSQEKLTVENFFKEVQAQTPFVFSYDSKKINRSSPLTFTKRQSTVEGLLKEASGQSNLSFRQINHSIDVKVKEQSDAAVTRVDDQITVTGTVTDAKGDPLPGVTISIPGTAIGTATDLDGAYSLSVPEGSTLVFSFIGFQSQTVELGGRSVIDIVMREDLTSLDEVVVVGYGTQRRSDVTTAVSSVSAESLQNRPALNFGEAIAGQMAGVQVQQISGAPGGEGLAIRIRGVGSITQSNDPLYVVDGYPMEGNAFRLLNTSDIESIQVLKDASSTAIYGSRGANGVVIITTKKGAIGPPTVSINSFVGFQERSKEVGMMNRDQYVSWFIDGRNQAWLDAPIIAGDPDKSPHSINDPNSRRSLYPSANSQYMIPDGQGGYKYNFFDPASVALMPDNNWQELLFRRALTQQNELSISGGSENTQYTFSGSYIKQDGIVLNTSYDRFNFRSNINSKISNTINVGVNLMAYSSNGKEQANGKDAPVMYALNLPPIYPLRNEDGTYGSMVRNPEILAGDVANPIGIAEQVYNNRKRYGWMGTIFGEWHILPNLQYRISINGGIQDNEQEIYEASYIDFDASKAPRPARGINQRGTDFDWVIENTLNYSKTFADVHQFSALMGYTTQKHTIKNMRGEARGFANDNITTLNAGTMYALSSDKSEYSMISYLGRVNYSYDNRYLLTATFRGDGSSRFGMNKKWGTFPSLSLGWKISEENFMGDVTQISNIMVRAGFGISGNNRIGNYSSIGLLSTGFYPTGDALQITVNPSTMPNDDLGWEKTQQYNLGFGFGVFNNRVRVEGDFYDSESIDLLLNVPVPVITGYSSQIQNIGKVQNRGMEFVLSSENFVNEFQWTTDFNISFNRNKVLALGPDARPIFGSAPNANNSFITTIGYPIASFWGYKYEGVFMSQDELDRYPHLNADKVGDGRYADINEDGVLDQNDKTILGNNHPNFTAGLSNNFSYKNFTLGIQLTAFQGAELFSFYKRMVGIYHGDRNGTIEQLNRWRSVEQPGDGIHFRASRTPSGWQRDPSSAWIQDASYLRLRNINFAYNIPTSLTDRLNVKALRLYVTGSNLFTITKYAGYDPETSSEGSGLSKGGDYLGYPTARSFILGVNLTF
jgi:TonB-linked SusC/RagA family outer membrane protein